MTNQKTARLAALALAAVALAGFWSSRSTLALSPDSAPALPAPTGTVINVSSAAALQAAVSAVASNQTIVIAPGTYNLTSTLWLNGTKSNVTIRGATNNRNDVVLVGQGMGVASSNVPFGIWTGSGVTNVTIANLTIRDVYQHAIMLNPGTESPRIYNVRLADGGEQLLKANPDGSGGGVDNGVVEYSVFEYTTTAPSDYTNAIDVHTGRDWAIRHNLFRRIRAPQGQLAGPAVLMWNGSSGTTVEANTFIDNHRDISLGLISRTPNDHSGGIIRNNFIVRSPGSGGDVPIAVFDSPSTKVIHNSIWTNGQYPNAIEIRFADTTGVTVRNNLSDRGMQNRDGAASAADGNIWTAASNWFVSANAGNLHLTSNATAAIGAGVATADAATDWDGQARPSGGTFDVGADEYTGSTTPPADMVSPTVAITSPSSGVMVSGTITLSATASDNVGVAGVWFTIDGVTTGSEDPTSPYQLTWNTRSVSNGTRSLRAVARDAAGNVTTSTARTVTVNNQAADTTAPVVALTAPSAGATVSGTATITASASDNVGVTSVQFTLNGVNLGSPDTTAPFGISWNTKGALNGSHALRAIARDAAGNVTMSATRVVAVSNTVAPPPASSSCSTPDPFTALGGGTCHDGGWLPPGMTPPAGHAPASPSTPPTQTQPPSTSTCASPRPGASWVCHDGGWLPPGMTPPAGSTPAPSAPPPQTPPQSSSTCVSPRPGASWVCHDGGWLPPGMTPPAGSAPAPVPSAPPPQTPPQTSSTCASPRPGASWVCHNGGWLPPGMTPPTGGASAPPSTPAVPTPPLPQPSTCESPRPGPDWVCRGGGWLPPGHPGS